MATFEEEALKRARQMQNHNFYQNEKNRNNSKSEKEKKYEKSEEIQNHTLQNVEENDEFLQGEKSVLKCSDSNKQQGVFDFLLADKEQSLLLLLLLLLTGENADPALLFALMYILI